MATPHLLRLYSEEGAGRAVERRGDMIEGDAVSQPLRREELAASPQAFAIPTRAVVVAWQRVKANRGAAGRDGESLAAFEQKLPGHLYRIWNRLVSGSDFPPPVKEVGIPKASGGGRPLGMPLVPSYYTAIQAALELLFSLSKGPW